MGFINDHFLQTVFKGKTGQLVTLHLSSLPSFSSLKFRACNTSGSGLTPETQTFFETRDLDIMDKQFGPKAPYFGIHEYDITNTANLKVFSGQDEIEHFQNINNSSIAS